MDRSISTNAFCQFPKKNHETAPQYGAGGAVADLLFFLF